MNIKRKATLVHKPIRKVIQKKDKIKHKNKTSVVKTKTSFPDRGKTTYYEWLLKLKSKPLKDLMASMDTVRLEIQGLDHGGRCQLLANYATVPAERRNKTFNQWLLKTGLTKGTMYECMNALGFKGISLFDLPNLCFIFSTLVDPISEQVSSDSNRSDSEADDDFNPGSDISSIEYQSDFHTSASEASDFDSSSDSES